MRYPDDLWSVATLYAFSVFLIAGIAALGTIILYGTHVFSLGFFPALLLSIFVTLIAVLWAFPITVVCGFPIFAAVLFYFNEERPDLSRSAAIALVPSCFLGLYLSGVAMMAWYGAASKFSNGPLAASITFSVLFAIPIVSKKVWHDV